VRHSVVTDNVLSAALPITDQCCLSLSCSVVMTE